MKLQIDLVPRTSWAMSLRNNMPRSAWDKLRKEVHARNKFTCQICGSKSRLNCHEHWAFNDRTTTQKLVGLGTVCSLCHHVAHFGRSVQLAAAGHLDLEEVIRHFLKVNGCDRATFEEHSRAAQALFEERSRKKWRVDFAEYVRLTRKSASRRRHARLV
jgi:hypothetical protein